VWAPDLDFIKNLGSYIQHNLEFEINMEKKKRLQIEKIQKQLYLSKKAERKRNEKMKKDFELNNKSRHAPLHSHSPFSSYKSLSKSRKHKFSKG